MSSTSLSTITSTSVSTITSTSVSTINYPMTPIRSWDDLEKASNSNQQIQQQVADISQNYHTINVKNAMFNLTQVGSLLQMSYSGSKGFPCCKNVVRIMSNYQSLVKDSYLASTTFVEVSLQALKYHRFALLLTEKGKVDKAVEMLSKTAGVAGEMVKVSQELIDKSQSLCHESREALVAATNDETVTHEKRKLIQKAIADLEAKEKSYKRMTKELADAVEEKRKEEAKAAKEAKEALEKAFVVSIVSAVMKPLGDAAGAFAGSTSAGMASKAMGVVGNLGQQAQMKQMMQSALESSQKAQQELLAAQKKLAIKKKQLQSEKDPEKLSSIESEIAELEVDLQFKLQHQQQQEGALKKVQDSLNEQAKSYQDRELQIAKQRASIQKELRNANAELEESVAKLASSNIEKDDLDKSIASLEVAVKTLGKVITVFQNARLFWMGVQKHCKRLANLSDIKDTSEMVEFGYKQEFTDAIKESGLSWLALGKINRTAALSMKDVNDHVDKIMTDLPTKQESLTLLQEMSSEMIAQLQQENSRLLMNHSEEKKED